MICFFYFEQVDDEQSNYHLIQDENMNNNKLHHNCFRIFEK